MHIANSADLAMVPRGDEASVVILLFVLGVFAFAVFMNWITGGSGR